MAAGLTKGPFALAALDHVVLRVPDMDEALFFYRDILGATIERRVDQFGLIQLRAGEAMIDLVDVNAEWLKAQGAKPFTADVRNVDHICLRVDPFDEAAIEKHLKLYGVEIAERGSRYGAQGSGPSVYVRDPFGTVIELKGPPTPIENTEPVLKTERLVLRPIRTADAEALLAVFRDEETMRYWAHAPINALADMQRIVAGNMAPQNRAEASFAITRDGGRALGCVNFYNERDATSGLGYILERGSWGQGLVAEAVRAAVAHGFNRLKLHRIYLDIDPRNLASIRVAEKCGFVYEGTTRKSYFISGAYLDSTYYGLLYEDWIISRDAGDPSAR